MPAGVLNTVRISWCWLKMRAAQPKACKNLHNLTYDVLAPYMVALLRSTAFFASANARWAFAPPGKQESRRETRQKNNRMINRNQTFRFVCLKMLTPIEEKCQPLNAAAPETFSILWSPRQTSRRLPQHRNCLQLCMNLSTCQQQPVIRGHGAGMQQPVLAGTFSILTATNTRIYKCI